MASDRAIGRYRRWYARLLRLYPRPFQARFGEPMAQTFTDLCRERHEANRGLHAFALGTFAHVAPANFATPGVRVALAYAFFERPDRISSAATTTSVRQCRSRQCHVDGEATDRERSVI